MGGEWKPIQLFTTILSDVGATDVADFTTGTGAAYVAAKFLDLPYKGFCHNEAHKEWLHSLMQRLLLALMADKKVAVEDEVLKNVQTHLQRAAEGARKLLPQDSSAIGDCLAGDDDSEEGE